MYKMITAPVLALVLCLVATGLASGVVAAAPKGTLILRARQHVSVGDAIRIVLSTKGVSNLGGYETQLLYDKTAAHASDLAQRDNDFGKFKRDVGPLGVVQTAEGIAFGLYSCSTAECVQNTTERQGGARRIVRLATVVIVPDKPGILEIALGPTKVVDIAGNPLEVDLPTAPLQITVTDGSNSDARFSAPGAAWSLSTAPATNAGPFDQTDDGLVTHADAMEVALGWTTSRESGAPCGAISEPRYDVNHDSCIDVADLQMVAANYSPTGEQAAVTATVNVFTVNSAVDAEDANKGNGVCATSSGVCTLRAAISEAGLRAGADTIRFNIPGTGVQTIYLTKILGTLWSNDTIIDGYTQPGASPNTLQVGSNAKIMIQIQGQGETAFGGITITGTRNTLRGLSFYKLNRPIYIYGTAAADNKIVGNFIGTNAAATYYSSIANNYAYGISIDQGALRTIIGSDNIADRNVISGNAQHGIALWHERTNNTSIINNIIGLSPLGDRGLPNKKHGIDINWGSANNIVRNNVVSGNVDTGIEISHSDRTVNNQVINNNIGTDLTGTSSPLHAKNLNYNMILEDGVSNNIVSDNVIGRGGVGGIWIRGTYATTGNVFRNNLIGVSRNGTPIPNTNSGILANGVGSIIGPSNIIANNTYGIIINENDKDRNKITQNSIYNNVKLGIDLSPIDSVNPNDAGDSDTGPNQQLNYPVIAKATPLLVNGSVCPSCTVEVYVSDSGAGAYGEGKTFLGTGTADSAGTFSIDVAATSGSYVTAIAIDATGNTSEFSLNKLVSP